MADAHHYSSSGNGAPYDMPLYGDVMTLCGHDFEFYRMTNPLQSGIRFSNAHGLFALLRPGLSGRKVLYFSFPWADGLWYDGSPDMTIHFNTEGDDPTEYCSSSGKIDRDETYEVSDCYFCSSSWNIYAAQLSGDIMDYMANTDYYFMNEFWSDNIITVGLRQHASGQAVNNFYDFVADTNQSSSCTIPQGASIVTTLTLSAQGEYEILKDFSPIAQDSSIYITVQANFKNGEFINETKCVTANNSSISNVTVQFRGLIQDYSASSTNYLITIKK